jgi:hypothetical protein
MEFRFFFLLQGRRGLDLGHNDGRSSHGLRAQLQQGCPCLGSRLQVVGQTASNRRRWTIGIETGLYPQRYIIDRVSYRYLDPEAVFQLLLFVKTQVTSGEIL